MLPMRKNEDRPTKVYAMKQLEPRQPIVLPRLSARGVIGEALVLLRGLTGIAIWCSVALIAILLLYFVWEIVFQKGVHWIDVLAE